MESLIKKKNIAKIKSRIKSDNGKVGHSCESLHAEKRRRNFQKALRVSTPSTLAVAFNVHPLALYGFSISSNLSTRLPEKRSATGYQSKVIFHDRSRSAWRVASALAHDGEKYAALQQKIKRANNVVHSLALIVVAPDESTIIDRENPLNVTFNPPLN